MSFWNTALKAVNTAVDAYTLGAFTGVTGGESYIKDGYNMAGKAINNGWNELTGVNSAKETNAQNIAMQNATNAQNINLADTAHQREVADMKAAGINPILSAGGNGASTPALESPQAQNPNPGGKLGQINQIAGIMNMAANTKNLMSSAKVAEATVPQIQANTKLLANNSAKSAADTQKAIADTQKTIQEINTKKPKETIMGKITNTIEAGENNWKNYIEQMKKEGKIK